MEQVNIIGVDLAKRSFQLHGARADGSVAFRRKVSREKFLYFLAALRRCVVAMEACASAHHWGREIMQFGHDVRLVPPIYVKPFSPVLDNAEDGRLKFRSTPPREGRLAIGKAMGMMLAFRSTPPREGRPSSTAPATHTKAFRSTPPREGRPASQA